MSQALSDQQRRGRLIDPLVLSGLANLELIARTVAQGSLIGLHRSPGFGFSQEFAEYRNYEPGDDFRHIDWNVFARSDRTYVKRFRGDTNHHVMVLFDQSASMGVLPLSADSLSKGDYARFMAAAVVYLAARQHDAVGLLLFNEVVQDYLPLSTRRPRTSRLYHRLDQIHFGGGTDWQQPFEHLQARLTRRSLLVLISDFYSDPELLRVSLQRLRARGHEVLLLHVLDEAERDPVSSGSATVEDTETGELMVVSQDRVDYGDRLDAHCQALEEATRTAEGHYLRTFTDQPLDRVLGDYLRYRLRSH